MASWTTRGSGTVGGRSSAAPQFSGSLNFDQGQYGEAPSIDFAGTERTVPWATWYENTTGTNFENDNIFASRFDNTGDANQGKWIFGGQGRGTGGGTVPVPSLNIDTNQAAENPSIAGGSATDPTKPGPWVTFQEFSGLEGVDQIFAERPLGPGMANCDGVTPAGVPVEGHVPAIGGFCWQQTGVPRSGTDPSLNVDTSREGVEPDIAFTGHQRQRAVDRVVREGPEQPTACTPTKWCSRPRASKTAKPRTAASTGSPWARRSAASSTRAAPTIWDRAVNPARPRCAAR